MPNLYRICDECKKPVPEAEVNIVSVPSQNISQNYCAECFKSVNYDTLKKNASKNKKT
jgi:hypothetical protein